MSTEQEFNLISESNRAMQKEAPSKKEQLICDFPGCNKRAREGHVHPNGLVKAYCTEHIRKVRQAEKES